jgi:hypothetical protein
MKDFALPTRRTKARGPRTKAAKRRARQRHREHERRQIIRVVRDRD